MISVVKIFCLGFSLLEQSISMQLIDYNYYKVFLSLV